MKLTDFLLTALVIISITAIVSFYPHEKLPAHQVLSISDGVIFMYGLDQKATI
jgi:hypothetical protein